MDKDRVISCFVVHVEDILAVGDEGRWDACGEQFNKMIAVKILESCGRVLD